MSRLSILIFLFFSVLKSFSQAPIIKYATPQTLIVGQVSDPLIPVNTGGNVPANIYKQVSTFAGSGIPSSVDGAGISASFNMPSAIGIDANNIVYVCDYGSNAVRKITPNGTCTTIGTVNKSNGLTIDLAGNLYISSASDNKIYKITSAGAKSTFASGFNNPAGMCFDNNGNLIVADQGNNKIKKVTPSGHVSTIAGTGQASSTDGNMIAATFNSPNAIAIDKQGNIFVADSKNNKIRKITPSGITTTFAGSGIPGYGDGTGINTKFNNPTGLTFDKQNNLYVADNKNNRIRIINSSGEVITLAGTGTAGNSNANAGNATFNGPSSLVNDTEGNLLITDFTGNTIRKISLTGYTIDKPLPSGLTFDSTNGIISGTPAIKFYATDYGITAYNEFGSSNTVISIEAIIPTKITFLPIPSKTLCDGDFDPGAVSGLPLYYVSSNLEVAEIINGKVHIIGPGVTTIVADNGIETESQVLSVSGFSKPYAVITASAYSICEGVEVTFSAVTDNAGENPGYTWMVNGNDVGINNIKFVTSTLKDGDVITFMLTNNDNCIPVSSSSSNQIKINVNSYISPSFNITTSETGPVCAGFPITFMAIPLSNLASPIYSWLINNKKTRFTGYSFTSTDLKQGDVVTCEMESFGQCIKNPIVLSNAITISIRTDCETVVPNSFSPNGDGTNDVWKIRSLNPDAFVKVFNRNGSIIFQSNGYSSDWDGTSNGKEIPTGTYYYLIISDRGTKKTSGSVTVLR